MRLYGGRYFASPGHENAQAPIRRGGVGPSALPGVFAVERNSQCLTPATNGLFGAPQSLCDDAGTLAILDEGP
jgi:hypothetical protein